MSHTGGRRQPYAMRALHGFERRHHAAGVVTGVVVVVALLAAAPSPASASAADGSACSNPGDCASNFCASNVCTALPAITYEGGYEVRRQQSHAGAGLFTLPAGVADFYGKSAGDLAAWNPFPDDGGDWSRIDDTLAVPNERFVKCRQICDMFAGCNYAEVAYGKQCNLYASISGYQGSTLSTFMAKQAADGDSCSSGDECYGQLCISSSCASPPAAVVDSNYLVRRQIGAGGTGTLATIPSGVTLHGITGPDSANWDPFPGAGGDWTLESDALAVPDARLTECQDACEQLDDCVAAEISNGRGCSLYSSFTDRVTDSALIIMERLVANGGACTAADECVSGICAGSICVAACADGGPCVPTIAVADHDDAGVCSKGLVPVALLTVEPETPGADAFVMLTLDSGSEMPVTPLKQADGTFALSLTKTAQAGAYTVTATAHAEGNTADITLDLTVTCPDVGGAASLTSIDVDVRLAGFVADDLTGVGVDANAFVESIARGVGVPEDNVAVSGAVDAADGLSTTVSLTVDVPVENVATDRTVSITLDTAGVAGNANAAARQLAFNHAARTLARTVGICCTATYTEV